jgi:hypothetical protein
MANQATPLGGQHAILPLLKDNLLLVEQEWPLL